MKIHFGIMHNSVSNNSWLAGIWIARWTKNDGYQAALHWNFDGIDSILLYITMDLKDKVLNFGIQCMLWRYIYCIQSSELFLLRVYTHLQKKHNFSKPISSKDWVRHPGENSIPIRCWSPFSPQLDSVHTLRRNSSLHCISSIQVSGMIKFRENSDV